jgi:hypothetical protein
MSNNSVWKILGLPVLLIVGALLFSAETDKAKYDRLKVGMSREEVQAIVSPKTGKWGRHVRDLGDNEILHLNDRMVLTIQDGVLVDKKWIAREKD